MREEFVDWLLVLATGRVWLAFLPPSSIGALRPREFVATLVACTLCGTAALWPQHLAWHRLGLPLPSGTTGVLVWLAPWALAALAWRAFGPAALVPRHEDVETRHAASRAAEALLLVGALAGQVLAWDTTLNAELASWPSRWPFAAGIAFALTWLRRADRRALVLAAIAFGLCAGTRRLDGWLGVCGLLGIVLATPAPARRRAQLAAALALLLLGLPLAYSSIEKGPVRHWWGIEISR